MGKKSKKKRVLNPVMRTNNDIVALIEKKAGNEAYGKSNYAQAIDHYTTGISLSAKNPPLLVVLLINRATSFLRIKEFYYAIEDSSSALLLEANARAHICRAFGYFFMQQYTKAFEDYELASKLEPDNVNLQKALQRAKEGLTAQLKKIKDVATAAPTGKKIRDTALEWVGDFGLLCIDEEPLPNVSILNKPSVAPNPTHKHPAQNKDTTRYPLAKGSDTVDEPPPLIPVGDWVNGMGFENDFHLLANTAEQRCKIAMDEKLAGNAAFKAQQYYTAVGHYSKAIWLNCRDGVYYSNRGMAYIKLGRWAEAITDCSVSLVYGPSVKAFLRRGTAWAAVGSYWLAIQDYKHALEYEPTNRDCIKGIDCALTTLGDQTRTMLVDDPNSEQLLATNHRIHVEFQALAGLRTAAEQTKVDGKGHTSKSTTPTSTSADPNAPSPAPNTKQPSPTKPQHSDFAKLQEMLSRFTTMIAADKLNTGALMGRADIYIQLGDIDKAMADYHFGLKLDPDNPELLKRWHAVKKKKGA